MVSFRFSVLILILSFSALFPNTSQNFLFKALMGLKEIMMPTISSNPDDIGFYLYPNPDNLMDADKLIFGDTNSYQKARLKPNLPFVFLIHGFTQNYLQTFPQNVKDAYLKSGYAPYLNIICVDWGKLTHGFTDGNPLQNLFLLPAYSQSATNVLTVGDRVAKFVEDLMEEGYLDPDSGGDMVHLIGFSLGSHAAGSAGMHFKRDTDKLIYRITGLEPAGPQFQDAPARLRLSADDASFVDCVHTNEGVFGFIGPLCDIDFFVNGGGKIQPDCDRKAWINNTFVGDAKFKSECSHNTAPIFYAESIRNKTMKACPGHAKVNETVKCEPSKQVTFGENCPPGSKGIYSIQIHLDFHMD